MGKWFVSSAVVIFVSTAVWITSASAKEVDIRSSPAICIANADVEVINSEGLRTSIEQSRLEQDHAKFHRLLNSWKQERRPESWVADMVACPSYQKIMGMGTAALPLIFQQMESEANEPDHWFWALRSITETDPVQEADRGNITKMASAWLEWGRLQGYAW